MSAVIHCFLSTLYEVSLCLSCALRGEMRSRNQVSPYSNRCGEFDLECSACQLQLPLRKIEQGIRGSNSSLLTSTCSLAVPPLVQLTSQ